MQRRTLLKATAIAGVLGTRALQTFALGLNKHLEGAPGSPSSRVHTVLLVAKCHLDVGFSQTQADVMRKYFDVYYPAAIKTSAAQAALGSDRYTWTTGSWLLYEYLEQANASQRRTMDEAVQSGAIAWHALPFSWQTEMLDRSMIEGAMGFSATLDKRYGVKTIGAKMTDVPGHSRGLIAPLADAGVRLLDIGVNAASTPPNVPDLFVWKDPGGKTLAVMYHRHDYGSVLEIPGSGVAVDVEVRGDNSGPHSPAEIAAIYAKLRTQFPGAEIKAATMNDVAAAVGQVASALPVVTSEIGDTWIYGCASDPYKVARYRSVARLRTQWIAQGAFAAGDATDRGVLRRLLLAAEHTWGTDTKSYLDDTHYRPADLAKVLDRPGYLVMERSWKEKRDDIDVGISALPTPLRNQAEKEVAALRPSRPEMSSLQHYDPRQQLETKYFILEFDSSTGAIVRLHSRVDGTEWASADHPLALLTYQTLSAGQYADFLYRYITVETDWAPKDFGKPGIESFVAIAQEWHPRLVRISTSATKPETYAVLELAFDDAAAEASGNLAWPKEVFVELRFPGGEARIDLEVLTFIKAQNRMPEALWLTFAPSAVPESWELEKVNQTVSAFDVVQGGGRAMHAVSEAVQAKGLKGRQFRMHTLDAPVIALGKRSPLNFSSEEPDLKSGVHVSLFNNAWGTNYPQWCGGDWRYRFSLFT